MEPAAPMLAPPWPEPPPDADRRRCRRYATRGILLVRPAEAAGALARTARVLDVSRGGLCLLLTHPYPAGERLRVAPFGWAHAFPDPVEVVHVRQSGDLWVHGCKFPGRLSRAGLRAWLHTYASPSCAGHAERGESPATTLPA